MKMNILVLIALMLAIGYAQKKQQVNLAIICEEKGLIRLTKRVGTEGGSTPPLHTTNSKYLLYFTLDHLGFLPPPQVVFLFVCPFTHANGQYFDFSVSCTKIKPKATIILCIIIFLKLLTFWSICDILLLQREVYNKKNKERYKPNES